MSYIIEDLQNNSTPLIERAIEEIESLERELADSTDGYALLFKENGALKAKIEALEKDAARLDFIGYHGLLCLDSASNKAGGNGQKHVAATRCNIDAAIAGEAT